MKQNYYLALDTAERMLMILYPYGVEGGRKVPASILR